jgi:hypothetical protein
MRQPNPMIRTGVRQELTTGRIGGTDAMSRSSAVAMIDFLRDAVGVRTELKSRTTTTTAQTKVTNRSSNLFHARTTNIRECS